MSDPWIESILQEPSPSGCRDWPYKSLVRGYPVVKIGGRSGRVVRVSNVVLERHGMPRPDDKHEALHSCDRPICCAYWHLRWGTRSENIAECIARNRFGTGERHYAARLTDAKAALVRADTRSQSEIAAAYDIDQSQVSRIKNGKTYRNPGGLYW
jgi:hypothetical protein